MSQVFGDDWAHGQARASRWGHAGPSIIVGVLASMAVLAMVPVQYPTGGRQLLSLSFIVLLLVTFAEMRKHDRGLCERCAADFPLNPAQAAETYSRRLATVHLMADKRVAVRFLVALLVACLLPIFAPGPLHTPAMILWLASLASLIYVVQSGVTHRRLQPWCPQCGHQGGSDNVHTPEPMPLDSRS